MPSDIISINIAELAVSKEPVVISTVLGSCVSVCLHSPKKKFGGMIHFALPHFPKSKNEDPLRYGDTAIPQLVKEMQSITGENPREFIAKIIGGANGIGSIEVQKNIGEENVRVAKEILAQLGIKIVGEDTGGDLGRKALFHVSTARLQSAFVGPGFSRPSALMAASSVSVLQKNSDKPKIKVLIVDDSKTIRDLLCKIISQDKDLVVVGQAEDPIEAEKLLHTTKPDVITLDVHMPKMTGVQWLESLLPRKSIPVVMITSLQLQDGNEVFRALELGAVDYIQKPSLSELSDVTPIIREKVKSAASAKVRKPNSAGFTPVVLPSTAKYEHGLVIAIGASTGGTEALRAVLTRLPKKIPPILIVQHIPPVFSRAFADRMNSLCPFDVKEAEDGDAVHEDRVLIAPGGSQMKVVSKTSGIFVNVNNDPLMSGHRPSVDYLFHSVASLFGRKAVGAILTGMGADGSKGLLEMKKRGAQTISQDEATCVVYGMPKVAWEIGASEEIVSLEKIAEKLIMLSSGKKRAA